MGVHSGTFGAVNGQPTIRQWSVNDQRPGKKFVASNTRQGAGRVRGISDWSGSFGQYGHTPSVMPRDIFNFVGYTAPDNDAYGGVGTRYSGSAIVDQVQITWNWGSGDPLSIQVSFSANGALTALDGQAAILDNTDPVVPHVCATRIEYAPISDAGSGSGSGSYGPLSEWPNIVQAVLTLSATNPSYVNSSTACATGRRPGPIDWTLSITEQATERQVLDIDKGEDIELALYVNEDDDCYRLLWGHVENFSNIQVDRETGAIIARTVNLSMNGFNPDTGVAGAILLPGQDFDTKWWPF